MIVPESSLMSAHDLDTFESFIKSGSQSYSFPFDLLAVCMFFFYHFDSYT